MSWVITGTEKVTQDPYLYTNTVLLLKGNADGGGNILDSSKTAGGPKTVSKFGQAASATPPSYPNSNSAFGNAISFDGTGDFITVPASTAFSIGSENYTAELWFYVNANPGSAIGFFRRHIIGNYSATATGWGIQLRGSSTAYTSLVASDGNDVVVDASLTISQNAWHHVAFTKNGADCRLFLNGSQVGATGSRLTFASTSTEVLYIGRINFASAEGWDFSGHMDEIRLTKGVARYETGTGANAGKMVFAGTNTLALPTAPFPDI